MLDNRALVAAFVAWFVAQAIKLLVGVVRDRRINLRYLVSTGGMPSAHSALVTALTTAIARQTGLQSPLFAISAVFAAVVLYDAAGLRQAVSIQARILNRMLDEIFSLHAISEGRLREFLGHTPFEVSVGFGLGVLVGFLSTL
jgi:acid phosphatase family membrane protein YuiD